MWWDISRLRLGSDLPDRHEATVTYTDAHEQHLTSKAVLDWGLYRQRITTDVKGLHDLARSVETLSQTVQSFREGIHGGLAVVVRDGDASDQEEERQRPERQRQHDNLVRRLLPDHVDE